MRQLLAAIWCLMACLALAGKADAQADLDRACQGLDRVQVGTWDVRFASWTRQTHASKPPASGRVGLLACQPHVANALVMIHLGALAGPALGSHWQALWAVQSATAQLETAQQHAGIRIIWARKRTRNAACFVPFVLHS